MSDGEEKKRRSITDREFAVVEDYRRQQKHIRRMNNLVADDHMTKMYVVAEILYFDRNFMDFYWRSDRNWCSAADARRLLDEQRRFREQKAAEKAAREAADDGN